MTPEGRPDLYSNRRLTAMCPEDSAPPARFEVSCHQCQAPFDSLAAVWCTCLVAERTVVCPSCGSCFCKAPRAYRLKFWSDAPKSLWEAKIAEHTAAFESPPNPAVADLRRPLVLVVEDDPAIQRVAMLAVERLGYGALLAKNGAEGLALAHQFMPDAVLSDALMPRMDGRELCRRLKEDPVTRHIKVAVMTSLYTGARYRAEAAATYRVDEYLAKPLDPESLKETLEKLAGPPRS